MDQNQRNKLESIENDIRKALEEKRINENNALDFIRALKFFIGNQPPKIQNLSAYKLLDDLIDLLPSSREMFEARIENLKIILELEPANVITCSLIADLYEIIWDHTNAIKYFLMSYELNPNPELLYRIGMRYRFLNNNNLAIDYFNRSIEQGYLDSDVCLALAKAFFSVGDYYNAKVNLDKALYFGLDEEEESKAKESLDFIDKITNTTELLNKLIKQINLKPITPLYSSSDEGKFISLTGEEFFIWRFFSDVEGTEVLRVSDNNSNAINFWFEEKSDTILLGVVFSHQDSPDKIQYFVTFQPQSFEELDSNKMMQRENSDVMDPQKRNIDPLFSFEEYKKLRKYLKKAGIEIIPDLKDIFLKNKER